MGWVFDGAVTWLSSMLLGALQAVWGLLAAFALTSPDVTALPQVGRVASRSLLVVNTVYVLAVLAVALLVMVRETVQLRYGVGDLAPRLVMGLVSANFSAPLCRGLIEAANALTLALTQDPITSTGSLQHLETMITAALRQPVVPGPQQILMLVVVVLLLALTLALVFGWLIRLGLLVLLTGIAPLALACHGLPLTEPVARLWWRSMLAALLVVTAQAFALHTTMSVFLSPQANLPTLGIPADPGGSMNLMIAVCLMWATVRIPTLARRYVTGSRPSFLGTAARVLVVQQLTRGLRGLLRRR